MFILFNLMIFLTGFLVLNIQLVFSKAMLPIFGGSPNIWIASLAFYQTVLTLGYAYSYFLQKKFSFKSQLIIHLFLLIITFLIFIPVGVNLNFINYSQDSVINLFLTILLSVGLPYFLITASSPLLQNWFGLSKHLKSNNPYLLYISSNIGTFSSLLCYPFLIELFLSVDMQFSLWSSLFIINIVLIAGLFIYLYKHNRHNEDFNSITPKSENINFSKVDTIKWMTLAFIPSAFLSAVTMKITTDIAPIPLMWVIPLGLYFISFSIGFSDKLKYQKQAALICITFAILAFNQNDNHNILLGIFYIVFLFLVSTLFHNKIYLSRPDKKDLTIFYLFVSIGGALGGIFVGVFSPMLFNGNHEFLILCILISIVSMYIYDNDIKNIKQCIFAFAPLIIIFTCLHLNNLYNSPNSYKKLVHQERTFFGTYEILDEKNKSGDVLRILRHGSTLHGGQIIIPETSNNLTLSYYSKFNPMATFKEDYLNKNKDANKFGIIGLGTGAMNCFFENKEVVFYEIDRAMIDIAKDYFNYLDYCKNNNRFILGDARISLKDTKENFDILYVDAFSSDAIPTHLITLEAIKLYLDNIKDNGYIVVHISNRYLNLEPVLKNIANTLNLDSRICRKSGKQNEALYAASTVFAFSNKNNNLEFLTDECWKDPKHDEHPLWTDKYSNIFRYLIFN